MAHRRYTVLYLSLFFSLFSLLSYSIVSYERIINVIIYDENNYESNATQKILNLRIVDNNVRSYERIKKVCRDVIQTCCIAPYFAHPCASALCFNDLNVRTRAHAIPHTHTHTYTADKKFKNGSKVRSWSSYS